MADGSKEIAVNWRRIEKTVRKLAQAISGTVPSSEAAIAGIVLAIMVAHNARADRTPRENSDIVSFLAGNLLLEYREGRMPIKFEKRKGGKRGF